MHVGLISSILFESSVRWIRLLGTCNPNHTSIGFGSLCLKTQWPNGHHYWIPVKCPLGWHRKFRHRSFGHFGPSNLEDSKSSHVLFQLVMGPKKVKIAIFRSRFRLDDHHTRLLKRQETGSLVTSSARFRTITRIPSSIDTQPSQA